MKRKFRAVGAALPRGYAIVMSLVAAVFLIGAAANRSAAFDTIDAHLINIRDSDGTVRLALFGKNREPPDIVDGKAYSGRAGGAHADAGSCSKTNDATRSGALSSAYAAMHAVSNKRNR